MGRRDTGRKERGRHPWERGQLEQRNVTHPEIICTEEEELSIPTLSLSSSFNILLSGFVSQVWVVTVRRQWKRSGKNNYF